MFDRFVERLKTSPEVIAKGEELKEELIIGSNGPQARRIWETVEPFVRAGDYFPGYVKRKFGRLPGTPESFKGRPLQLAGRSIPRELPRRLDGSIRERSHQLWIP